TWCPFSSRNGRETSAVPFRSKLKGPSYTGPALCVSSKTNGDEMGVTNVKATVGNPADNSRRREVEFLVDSGATYSLVPSEILSELEIEPHSLREFVLGNGEFVTRRMGTATFEYL